MRRVSWLVFVGLGAAVFDGAPIARSESFKEFQERDAGQFNQWRSGKPVKTTPAPQPNARRSEYETYLGRPAINTPEEQRAWDLYRGYVQAQKQIADAQAGISQIESRGAKTRVIDTWRILASREELARHAELTAQKAALEGQLKQVETDWGGTYSGYYGPLSDMDSTITVKYLDPNDTRIPQHTQQMEMNRIEFRLRSFPFSQRGQSDAKPTEEAQEPPPVVTPPAVTPPPPAPPAPEGEKPGEPEAVKPEPPPAEPPPAVTPPAEVPPAEPPPVTTPPVPPTEPPPAEEPPAVTPQPPAPPAEEPPAATPPAETPPPEPPAQPPAGGDEQGGPAGTKGGTEGEKAGEPQAGDENAPAPSATVAPALFRTQWTGQFKFVSEMMLDEKDQEQWYTFEPPLAAESDLAIDNADRVSGRVVVPQGAKALRLAPVEKDLTAQLDGQYDTRTGLFDVALEGRVDLPNQGANIAGVPMAFYIKGSGRMKGAAESDSAASGNFETTWVTLLEPSRPVTDDDINAHVWQECPEKLQTFGTGKDAQEVDINAGARETLSKELKKVRDAHTKPEETDRVIAKGTWRIAR